MAETKINTGPVSPVEAGVDDTREALQASGAVPDLSASSSRQNVSPPPAAEIIGDTEEALQAALGSRVTPHHLSSETLARHPEVGDGPIDPDKHFGI